MILHWQEFNNVVPTAKKDVCDQIVWNNRFIKINIASAYFRSWHQAGFCKLSSLFDESNTRFLSFNEFLRKFKVKCNFLQYHGLVSAMPSVWKKYLKQEEQAATVNLHAIDKLTCKTIYGSLIESSESFSPNGWEKTYRIIFFTPITFCIKWKRLKTLIAPFVQTSIKQSVIYSYHARVLVLSGRSLLNGISQFLIKH